MTRRSVLGVSGFVLAWAGVRRGLSFDLSADGLHAERSLLTHPVQVPADFVGIHAHRWPGDKEQTPAPSYAFGATRSHDHDGTAWNEIHRAPNLFAWESLDRWVAVHSAARRTLIYTLYGTPSWLASRTDLIDLYGRPGGASPPRDLAPLGAFVTALVQRYNGDREQRIHFVETWNEPHFEGDSGGFWCGTAEELVAIGRTSFLAAKSVDERIRVLSPGFVGELTGTLSLQVPRVASARSSPVYRYLKALDGHGDNGVKWCDAVAFHTYNTALRGKNAGYVEELQRLKKMLQLMKVEKPLFNTECGFVAPHPFRSLAPGEQAVCLRRLGVVQAALGVQGLFFYSHDDDFVGNPTLHPEVAQAFQELSQTIAGSTLHDLRLSGDGSVRFTTDRGAFSW